MGRRYTGSDTTAEAPRLELQRMLKVGYFTKGAEVSGTWSWTNGDRAEIVTYRTPSTIHMDIITRWKDYTGQAHEDRQRIYLHAKPSNLGRGEVLYFRCPHTLRPCRILYRAYSSRTWRSREGFSYRLYYPQQTLSGWTRLGQRERDVEAKLERLRAMRWTGTYQGKPTRRAIRIAKLEEHAERLAALAWNPRLLPAAIRRAIEDGLEDRT